jgi:calcineurin-like phosphoesterase family protein
MIYVTSDFHLSHKNIITYDDLPFTSVEEMNLHWFYIWHKTVTDDDTVIYLGDWALTNHRQPANKIELLVKQFDALPGKEKIFIRGNHDGKRFLEELRYTGTKVYDSYTLTHNDIKCHFVHNPNPYINTIGKKDKLYYGHTHCNDIVDERCINCCISRNMKFIEL